MATILRDAPIDVKLEDTLRKPEDEELLYNFYHLVLIYLFCFDFY